MPEGHYREPLSGPRRVLKGHDVTIISTAYMTLEAVRAGKALRQIGCSPTVFDLRVLRPLKLDPVCQSVRKTGRLVTVDTGWMQYGVGAEIVATVASECFAALESPPLRLGLPDHPTPSSRGMIPGFYPDADRIVQEVGKLLAIDPEKIEAARRMLADQRQGVPIDVPDPFFKGPF